jgi:hypothetical protein
LVGFSDDGLCPLFAIKELGAGASGLHQSNGSFARKADFRNSKVCSGRNDLYPLKNGEFAQGRESGLTTDGERG